MLCTVCFSKVNCVNGVFTCEEGHTFEHTMEVAERSGTTQSSIKDKESQTKKPHKQAFPKSYCRLVLFTAIFYEGLSFFELRNDDLLRLYIQTISHKGKEIIDDHGLVSVYGLYAIMYLTKRCEIEREDKPLLAAEYMRYMRFFPYKRHLKFFSSKIDKGSLKNVGMHIKRNTDYTSHLYNALSKLNKVFSRKNLAPDQKNAILKICRHQRSDKKIFFAYLDTVVEDFGLEKSPQLVFCFEKFVYTNNVQERVFSPEVEISTFLYEYMCHFDIIPDYGKIAKQLVERFIRLKRPRLLTKKLKKAIKTHRESNQAIEEAYLKRVASHRYESLKAFVSDYLGVPPDRFDKMRHRTLRNVENAIEEIFHG